MPLAHLLIALGVVAIWGTNFVVIKAGLATWPPLLFVALRFFVSVLPALVLPRPKVPLSLLVAYGLFIGVGQFGLLFYAMQNDITPGLASLVIQVQAFFTIGLSALLWNEPLKPAHIAGLALAAVGILLIAWQSGALAGGHGNGVTALGIGLALLAAASWSAGNLVAKRIGPTDVLPFIAWSGIPPALALIPLSLLLEGPERITYALASAGGVAWGAVVWQAVGNTLFGYGVWNWLLARHPAVLVAPMALLVPVFGMGASALVLGESLPAWKITAAAMVIGGLGITIVGSRRTG